VEVSERSERALRKTRILAMNPAKWLQTATSATKLTHSSLWLASFVLLLLASLKMLLASLVAALQNSHLAANINPRDRKHLLCYCNVAIWRKLKHGCSQQLFEPVDGELSWGRAHSKCCGLKLTQQHFSPPVPIFRHSSLSRGAKLWSKQPLRGYQQPWRTLYGAYGFDFDRWGR